MLYKGDCRDVLDTLIAQGVQVDLVVTSPPYDDMRTYKNTCEWNLDICKEIVLKYGFDNGSFFINSIISSSVKR